MSLDLTNQSAEDRPAKNQSPAGEKYAEDATAKDQWKSLRKKVRVRAEKQSADAVFGNASKRGSIYRWGVAVAQGSMLDNTTKVLSRLAVDDKLGSKDLSKIDFASAAAHLADRLSSGPLAPLDAARTVIWAAAMPSLIDHLDYRDWWALLGELQQCRELAHESEGTSSLTRLIMSGELGLSLSWRLADLPSCSRLRKASIASVLRWCEHEEDSIANSLAGGTHARLALASLLRCRGIMESVGATQFKKQQKNVLADLATWVAAMTTHNGCSAFSAAKPSDIKDDTKKNGLLDAAIRCDAEALQPAMNAARGRTQTGGRLVWEVSLPECVHHCEDSKIAVILPEWDVRRGKTHIDYSRSDLRLETHAGKMKLFSGEVQTSIEIDDSEQRPVGEWESACEYSDDDVHYLELEQLWSGSLVLQRQFLIIRDDRCVLFADSVLPNVQNASNRQNIRYTCRLPLGDSVDTRPESETREIFLGEAGKTKKKKANAIAIPLSAGEWRVGPSNTTLRTTEDHHLLISATGQGKLYAPLWLDFQRRRLKRKRTWRSLTVAEELRIVRPDEAVGYRIQIGSEQWVLYRSLNEPKCRSVLGKHLVADFYAGRFYLNDGSIEELVTVDDSENDR